MPSLVDPVLPPGSLGGREQPVLEAGGLLLRPWGPADYSALLAAYADPDIQRWHARSMTDREATAWIRSWGERWEQETGAGWAVTDGSRVLGRVGLKRIDLDEALGEVAYWVLADARGQRAATRALCAMSDWAFASGFHRLELVHAVENHALVSRRPGCRVSPGGNKAPRRAARRRLARHAPSRQTVRRSEGQPPQCAHEARTPGKHCRIVAIFLSRPALVRRAPMLRQIAR